MSEAAHARPRRQTARTLTTRLRSCREFDSVNRPPRSIERTRRSFGIEVEGSSAQAQ
jgi:hypothetical protein